MTATRQRQGTQQIEQLATDLKHWVQAVREQVPQTGDPRAKALLETSAEVANGLLMAFHHYVEQSEEAWE